jgi:hypothetical protein
MNKQIELKPCPFCGEPVELISDEYDGDIIICTDCGFFMNISGYDSIEEAVEIWNRRPSRWISVNDDSQSPSKRAFIYDRLHNRVSEAVRYYFGGGGWSVLSEPKEIISDYETNRVTYWMPLPEPPGKEEL